MKISYYLLLFFIVLSNTNLSAQKHIAKNKKGTGATKSAQATVDESELIWEFQYEDFCNQLPMLESVLKNQSRHQLDSLIRVGQLSFISDQNSDSTQLGKMIYTDLHGYFQKAATDDKRFKYIHKYYLQGAFILEPVAGATIDDLPPPDAESTANDYLNIIKELFTNFAKPLKQHEWTLGKYMQFEKGHHLKNDGQLKACRRSFIHFLNTSYDIHI